MTNAMTRRKPPTPPVRPSRALELAETSSPSGTVAPQTPPKVVTTSPVPTTYGRPVPKMMPAKVGKVPPPKAMPRPVIVLEAPAS